eukprot:TRINITY_DN11040_c0_g1_i2.p1 TRINITY_DN11040_c0_g1~~TRINITY_DN11040_c0_g1_i2.p1  ORF type:complete len:176 (+),score=47.08 TRINITY_DN11040_c0_g1_i2:120-647(+)
MPGGVTDALNILKIFQEWDVDGDGSVTEEELTKVLVKLGVERKKCPALFQAADANHDGVIDYEEFISFVVNGGSKDSVGMTRDDITGETFLKYDRSKKGPQRWQQVHEVHSADVTLRKEEGKLVASCPVLDWSQTYPNMTAFKKNNPVWPPRTPEEIAAAKAKAKSQPGGRRRSG